MMEVTYRDFRYFMRLLTRRAQLWTEMVVDDTILHNLEPARCDRFLRYHPSEHPIVCQLGGSDPCKLQEAAQDTAGFERAVKEFEDAVARAEEAEANLHATNAKLHEKLTAALARAAEAEAKLGSTANALDEEAKAKQVERDERKRAAKEKKKKEETTALLDAVKKRGVEVNGGLSMEMLEPLHPAAVQRRVSVGLATPDLCRSAVIASVPWTSAPIALAATRIMSCTRIATHSSC